MTSISTHASMSSSFFLSCFLSLFLRFSSLFLCSVVLSYIFFFLCSFFLFFFFFTSLFDFFLSFPFSPLSLWSLSSSSFSPSLLLITLCADVNDKVQVCSHRCRPRIDTNLYLSSMVSKNDNALVAQQSMEEQEQKEPGSSSSCLMLSQINMHRHSVRQFRDDLRPIECRDTGSELIRSFWVWTHFVSKTGGFPIKKSLCGVPHVMWTGNELVAFSCQLTVIHPSVSHTWTGFHKKILFHI